MNLVIVNANLLLAGLLFLIGLVGFFVKSNAISMLMCVELMLNAANLALATFGYMLGTTTGAILIAFVITLAAAEAGVGLAIFIALSRNRHTLAVGDFTELRN